MLIKSYPEQTNKQSEKNRERKRNHNTVFDKHNNNHITFRNELVPFGFNCFAWSLFLCVSAHQWRMRLFCYGNYLDSIHDMLEKVHTSSNLTCNVAFYIWCLHSSDFLSPNICTIQFFPRPVNRSLVFFGFLIISVFLFNFQKSIVSYANEIFLQFSR